MKKLGCLFLAVTMFLSLVACGNNPSESTTPSADTPTVETTEAATSDAPVVTDEPTSTESSKPSTEPAPVTEDVDIDSMTLKDRYADTFYIGCALPMNMIKHPAYSQLYLEQFNSLTMENEMKPDFLLNRDKSQKGLPDTYTEPVVNMTGMTRAFDFAVENSIKMRGHTLVWYSQTPKWFFTEDYTDNGPLVSKEVMLARMESYIKQVMTYCQDNYPGLIYAWDVVNEAVDPDSGNDPDGLRTENNMWYKVVGPEYIEAAFTFARKYAAEGVDLYYNDYNCYMKVAAISKMLSKLIDKGVIDGIGMQSHLDTSNKIASDIYYTARAFADLGLKISITELDIGLQTGSSEETQAMKYKVLFQRLEEADKEGVMDIQSITVWGLFDQVSWRKEVNPLLYTKDGTDIIKKRAWYGAMQAADVMDFEW